MSKLALLSKGKAECFIVESKSQIYLFSFIKVSGFLAILYFSFF